MVRVDMLKDPEWRKLPSSAKVIYIYLRAKFNHKDLSRVTLTYPELKDMMSPNTIAKAIKALEDNGWIKKVYQGGLFGGANKYQFVGEYKDYFYNKGRFKV